MHNVKPDAQMVTEDIFACCIQHGVSIVIKPLYALVKRINDRNEARLRVLKVVEVIIRWANFARPSAAAPLRSR